MENLLTIGMGSLLVGLLARVFIPWLAVRQIDPENAKWEWRYIWPQLLAFGILVLMLPLLVDKLDTVAAMPAQVSWLLGWGAADVGRKAYKALAESEKSE